MTKKISHAIITVSTITLFLSIIFIVCSLYNDYTKIQKGNQKDNLDMVSVGVSQSGMDYLENLHAKNYRVTWIANDGVVLYDSKANVAEMENHANRNEVIEALSKGYGEDRRVSNTLSEETLYTAKKLDDNTVIRISITGQTIIALIFNALKYFIVIAVGAVVLSIVLAKKVAKKTVEPINSLNLDLPLSCEVYDELTPLLHRIDKQNNKIFTQIETLKAQKKDISFIIENVADGIILLNDEGVVLSCNKVAKNLISSEEDSYYLNFFRDIDYENLIEDALKGISGNKKIKIDNEKFLFSASPTRTENSNFSVFLFIHNITEEENAVEIRRQFSANVSHELKTPLTTILGTSELMSNGIVKNEDVVPFAKNIYNEADRLLKLVQDIIEVSKLDEQSKFEFETADIASVTEKSLEPLRQKAKERNIVIKTDLKSYEIFAVSNVLYEMFYNLIDNAIIYNKDGGEISIDILKFDDEIVWKIKDSGVGIPKEHLPRIFERFYRVDKSHSKEIGGTGLGLSIVKNGAILHKAEIDVKSVVGQGTIIALHFKNK